MDDIIITGDDIEEQQLKKDLACEFDIKDLGRYFLGIEITYSLRMVFFSPKENIPWNY